MSGILILGLGNELMADDAVGILAAQELEGRLKGKAHVIATAEHGVVLLDYLAGYSKAVIVDAIAVGKERAGEVMEIDPSELMAAGSPSPHYTGIPDLFVLAERLGIDFPDEVVIFAVGVEDPYTLGGEMSAKVRDSLPLLIEKVVERVEAWESR